MRCTNCRYKNEFVLISIFYADTYVEIVYKCRCTPVRAVTRISYETYHEVKERRIKPWANL